jgi:hypothetical protein
MVAIFGTCRDKRVTVRWVDESELMVTSPVTRAACVRPTEKAIGPRRDEPRRRRAGSGIYTGDRFLGGSLGEKMRSILITCTTAVCISAIGMTATANAAAADPHAWVAESNKITQIVLEAQARFNPEGAAQLGVDGLDDQVLDLKPQLFERTMAVGNDLVTDLHKRLDQTTDPLVRQDVEILIKSTQDFLKTSQLTQDNLLPYINLSQIVYQGTKALIDPQVAKDRYPAMVVRLRKYAGLEPGFTPITQLARDRTTERFNVPGLLGPYKGQVETDLKDNETYISGIEELLKGTDLKGWQKPYKVLAQQLRDYNEWLRTEVLPRARDDFRQPPAIYEDARTASGCTPRPRSSSRPPHRAISTSATR